MMLTERKPRAVSVLNAYKALDDKVLNSQYVWVYDSHFRLRCCRSLTLGVYKIFLYGARSHKNRH